MKVKPLEDDGYCFICGDKNPHGLRLKFHFEGNKSFASFALQKSHQGYKDVIHGGIISTILDEAMIKVVLSKGLTAVTAEISVRFKSPLLVGEKATVEAEIKNMGKRLIEASSVIKKTDQTVVAEAQAKLLRYDR